MFDIDEFGAEYAGDMAVTSIDIRHLRPALEFAVLVVREGQKARPPQPVPSGFKRFLAMGRIPSSELQAVRRVVERDEGLRARLAAAVTSDFDPIGRLWLQRPSGWEAEAVRLVSQVEDAERQADAATRLARAQKQRESAEQAAVRARAEASVLRSELADRAAVIDGLRADVVKLGEETDELRAQLVDTRNEARHARDREAATRDKLAGAEARLREALAAQGDAEAVRDEVLVSRAELLVERDQLARLAATAESLAAQLAALAAPQTPHRAERTRRKALPMPGGVMGDSAAATDYLLRSGASILVDGYNVAKLAWPELELAAQRAALLDAVENVARRLGSEITVVFDGAGIIGATAEARRLVRIEWSPPGVTADDVIRHEVGRLPAARQVVVVTNDREIVRDVKSKGANTLSSDQLVAVLT